MPNSILVLSGGSMGSLFASYIKLATIRSQTLSQLYITYPIPKNTSTLNLESLETTRNDHVQRSPSQFNMNVIPCSPACKTWWDDALRNHPEFRQNEKIEIPINSVDDTFFDNAQKNGNSVDMVLLLDKSCNTRKLAHKIRSVLSDDGFCLTLQNGMGNVEILQEVLGADRVIQGSTSQGAVLLQPGTVKHTGNGIITITAPTSKGIAAAKWWVNTFRGINLPANLADDNFQKVLWTKLLVNAVINPLTALLMVKNGQILGTPDFEAICGKVVKEGVSVAERCGVSLGVSECVETVKSVAEVTSGVSKVGVSLIENTSSMLADVLRGVRTEIDFINGYIVKKGKEKGVDVSANEMLVNLVHMKEAHLKLFVCLKSLWVTIFGRNG